MFHKKCEALDVLKKHRDARLKEFLSEDEAIRYAQTGFEIVQNKHNDSSRSKNQYLIIVKMDNDRYNIWTYKLQVHQ